MPYSIEFDETRKIVHVIYSGLVELHERIKAVEEVCTSYADIAPLKIMVNVRDLQMHLSVHEQKTFGEFLAVHPGLKAARVAVLHQKSNNPNIVIDTTAFANGYKLAQFNDNDEAVKWLTPD